jgi:hypothetical protein
VETVPVEKLIFCKAFNMKYIQNIFSTLSRNNKLKLSLAETAEIFSLSPQ